MMVMHVSGWYVLVDIAALHLAKKIYNIKIRRCTIQWVLWFFCSCVYRIFYLYWLRIFFMEFIFSVKHFYECKQTI